MATDDQNLNAELRALLQAGHKLEAIKRYREATGAGLAAAKEAVEALERGTPLGEEEPADASLDMQIAALLRQGKKIQAIKLYRERMGVGLKEAKDAVETFAAEQHIVVPSGSGCLGVVLLFVILTSLAALAAF